MAGHNVNVEYRYPLARGNGSGRWFAAHPQGTAQLTIQEMNYFISKQGVLYVW